MSQRAHFWLRIASLCVILLAAIYPRVAPTRAADAAPRAQRSESAELARR